MNFSGQQPGSRPHSGTPAAAQTVAAGEEVGPHLAGQEDTPADQASNEFAEDCPAVSLIWFNSLDSTVSTAAAWGPDSLSCLSPAVASRLSAELSGDETCVVAVLSSSPASISSPVWVGTDVAAQQAGLAE